MGGRAGSFSWVQRREPWRQTLTRSGKQTGAAESKWPVGQGPECEFEDNSQHIMERHLLTENPSDKFDTNAAR